MGIIRLTLITLALIWAVMYFYGSDEGLPQNRLGREPVAEEIETTPLDEESTPSQPTPAVAPAPAQPEPAPTTQAEAPAPTLPTTSQTPVAAVTEAVQAATTAPQTAAVVEATAEPEPATAPEPDPEPQPEPEFPLYVSGRVVNVRSGPSTGYEAITSLRRGAAVIDLGDAGDGWRQIRLDNGTIGYMSGDFLSADPQ